LSDSELFNIIDEKDELGSTLLHYFASKSAKQNFLKIFIEFHNWIKNNIPGLELKSYLLKKNKWGRLFLHYLVIDDESGKAFLAITDTLGFLMQEYKSGFIKKFICSKDGNKSTVLHYFAENSRKQDFLKIFTELFHWIQNNIPDFDLKKLLLEKNKWGRIFLDHIKINDKNNEVSAVLKDIQDFLEKKFMEDAGFIQQIIRK
jgi:hypothetical protein